MVSLIYKTLSRAKSLSLLHRLLPTRLSLTPNSPSQRRAMSCEPTRRLFQLKHDPLTGNSEWIVIEEDDANEEAEEAFRSPNSTVFSTTSYLDMLNDSARNRAFRRAIDKTVTAPCHVLDIGAGTGLLSMMAARAMSGGDGGEGRVTACESYLPMVKLMRKVLHTNGMSRSVNVINKRSDELQVGVDIPPRADVLVSEILDSELLGEGLIPTLQHAHNELLVENPRTVPYRATVYGQLVESRFLWKMHDLYNHETEASDGIHLVPTGFDTILCVKSQQHPIHCDAITNEIKVLSEPFKIFEFEFWKRPDSHGEAELLIKASDNGRVHAIVSWWQLQLDGEGTISYSTAPRWIDSSLTQSTDDWCDHWKQCVWFIPGKGIPILKGKDVLLHAVHNETSIIYDLKTQAAEARHHNFNVGDFHIILSPERVAIYGDSRWRHSMLTALKNALQGRVQPVCVVADDSVFLTLLIANISKTSRIISLFPGLRDRGAQYLQAVASANGFSEDRVEVLRKKCLNLHDTDQGKVDLFIGEPYYCGNDGMLPWQNLRFWKERTVLDSVLAEDATIMPCKGILRACAMSLPDLWNSRRSLSKIEGLDHSVVNITLGACGELPPPQEGPLLPFFVWQCGEIKELSEAFTIMEFDFSKPMDHCCGKGQVEFTDPGICHGFALWIDWVMDATNSIVLSTGPGQRYWKQGVKLLARPVTVRTRGSSTGEYVSTVIIEASFDASNGELTVKHAFS